MKKITPQSVTLTGIFTALISILSSIPTGISVFGVPATLQTFIVAFTGFLLSPLQNLFCMTVYLLLGLIGIPVFSGFQSGPFVLFGINGGFLFGFLFLCISCSFGYRISLRQQNKGRLRIISACFFGCIGLLLCHISGVLQYAYITGWSIPKSFLFISLPYLPKDFLSIILAYFVARPVRLAFQKAKIQAGV